MCTLKELINAIAVPSVSNSIPDPNGYIINIRNIELGSTLGVFVIDNNYSVTKSLVVIENIQDNTLDCSISTEDAIIVRMRKTGMKPYESKVILESSVIRCIAIEDKIYRSSP